jgi:hypothetical protein
MTLRFRDASSSELGVEVSEVGAEELVIAERVTSSST